MLLVDDGSVDGSGGICDEYAINYDNIEAIHQKNNGTSYARNIGIKNSSSEWICFVDADDIAKEIFYKTILKYWDEEGDLIIFGHQVEDEKSNLNIVNDSVKTINFVDGDILIKKSFLSHPVVDDCPSNLRSVWGKLFRRSFLINNNIFFDYGVRQGEDMIFMLKIYSQISSARYISAPIYGYFFHNALSITNSYKPNYYNIVKDYVQAITPWLKKHPEYKIYHMNYRLIDIILYLKYDLFHTKNRMSDEEKRKITKQLFYDGPYKYYYMESKRNGLLKNYGVDKRIAFFFAVNNWYYPLKILAKAKYGR